jgi:hypothetical protein
MRRDMKIAKNTARVRTAQQESYMEHASRVIGHIGYRPGEGAVKVSKDKVKNSRDNWTIEQWDTYFKSRK